MLRYLSLFSGIGGFDLGLDRAGMTCAGQVEIDPACNALLSRYWPHVWRCNDVREVNAGNAPAVDLVCGGFPCQDVSVAGRRAGLAGERSGLWFEFRRILADLRPAWVVVENVPGLLSSNGGRDFAAILHGLVELGYGVCWRILDAQYFGVAQRRRRVFLVASLGNGRCAQVLFEREGVPGDSPPRRETGQEVAADAATCLRNSGRDCDQRPGRTGNTTSRGVAFALQAEQQHAVALDLFNGNETGEVAHTIQAGAKGHNYSPHTIPHIAHALSAEGADASEDGTVRGTPLICARSTGAGWYTEDDKGSVRAESGGTTFDLVGQLSGVRRLTPCECERLQGFPDGWTAGQADSARYRQLGNAVCVPVAEWIGRRIVAAAQEE